MRKRDFLLKQYNAHYVTGSRSFTETLWNIIGKRGSAQFKYFNNYRKADENIIDVLIADEAHRIRETSNDRFTKKSERSNLAQIEELIRASKVSVFFIDDNQRIRPEDIGSTYLIKEIAAKYNVKFLKEIELIAQFRCSGAEGYINWLDNTLQIRETANYDGWEHGDFDFKIFEDPNKLREEIKKRETEGFSSRILAGYAWKWTSQKEGNSDGQINDVTIPEHNFSMPWNSRKVGSTWAIDDGGIDQIGCIHTSQGLEFDYVGVIIGKDLTFNPTKLEYHTPWEC